MAGASFEQSLDHCLQALRRTRDIEEILRDYPRHADQLRPLLEIALATRRHYADVPEAPGGLAVGRERMLAAAARQRAAQQRVRGIATAGAGASRTKGQRFRLVFATRFVTILVLIVVSVTALGGGIVWAASNSLPGGLLYPVKLATEDTRLALASAPGTQVDLALGFVEERSEEAQVLAAAGRQVPESAIARMEEHVERALTQAAWATDEETVGLLAQIARRTGVQAQALEQAQVTAPFQARTRLASAAAVCRQGAEAAKAGLDDVQGFRWRYRHQQERLEPTHEPAVITATPEGDREKEQEQHQQPEREYTPTSTVRALPRRPRVTPEPDATPWPKGPQVTPQPSATPRSPQATPHPHGPQATPSPQITPGGSPAPPEPQKTPQGSEGGPRPQATPQGSSGTGGPRSTPRRP
jgi:hypothetical protein